MLLSISVRYLLPTAYSAKRHELSHLLVACFHACILFSGCPDRTFVRSFVCPLSDQLLLSMKYLNSLDKTDREYSLAHNDDPNYDLIRYWRSKVKGQGYRRPSDTL